MGIAVFLVPSITPSALIRRNSFLAQVRHFEPLSKHFDAQRESNSIFMLVFFENVV